MDLRLQAPAARRASDANLSAWFTQLADQVDALACSEPSSHRAIRQVHVGLRAALTSPRRLCYGYTWSHRVSIGVRATPRLQLYIGNSCGAQSCEVRPSRPVMGSLAVALSCSYSASQSSRMQNLARAGR